MRTAKISELKAKLSAHIQLVKNGDEILILDRNTPVARLVSAAPLDEYDEREKRLVAKGILTLPKVPRKAGAKWPMPQGPMIPAEVMEQIWHEERDGR